MLIDPEVQKFVREEVQRSVEQATASLRIELEALDEWANGLFEAMEELLQALGRAQPAVLAELEPKWRAAAAAYALAPDDAQRLEARKMLYGMLHSSGAFPRLRLV